VDIRGYFSRDVGVSVHDFTGREIRRWDIPAAGRSALIWRASQHAPGVYAIRASADGVSVARKLPLAKY
jgi:hypothetical protein